jgi:hypothetical protein
MSSAWSHFRFAFLTCALLTGLIAVISGPASAQGDTPSWNKNIPKPTPKPTPHPSKPPPRHTTTRRTPPPPAGPLLSVQFRIFKVNDNNSQVEVSPLTVFNKGDRLRIAMKSSEDVYLYVIHQQAPSTDGQLYFPDSRINNGQNFIPKNVEAVVPSACPPGTPAQLCGYTVDATAGQEVFTMIFTRNPSVDLLEKASGGINSALKPEVLEAYANSLNQKLDTSGRADSVFGRMVRNLNPKSNDKIIVRYVLNKRG